MTSDGLRRFTYDAEGRLGAVTTGATDASPTTRYAHNALGQRVFKTEPLYPPATGDESDPGFWQSLVAFFTQFWGPEANEAERQGWAYAYDEEGTLLSETGTGGAQSTGEAAYLWLPTASGPMPVMMVSGASRYAVVADHLNTPRRVVASSGELKWQWAYSAFGDAQPTVAERKFASVAPVAGDFEFNLRYPGQYFDKESGLFYNYFRTYCPACGRYTQADPIGLDGGWSRFAYVESNPLGHVDPRGLVLLTVGANVRVPLVGGATHSLGVSYFNGQWDAGLVVSADIPLVSAGKLLARASVDASIQSGDFCTNDKSYQENLQIGVKKWGCRFSEMRAVWPGLASIGPQLGASVSGQTTSTLSVRNNLLPWVSKLLDKRN